MDNLLDCAAPVKKVAASIPEGEISSTEAWLRDIIRRAAIMPFVERVTLSPGLASLLLQRNPDNRRMSSDIVSKYARDISNDAWVFNGEPVILSREGLLNDGQHRCAAVVEASRSIEVVLVVGASRDSRFTVDQGKARTAGDFLGMNGHKDSLGLAAAAAFLWQYREHGFISQQSLYRPTKGEVLTLVDALGGAMSASLAAVPRKGSDNVGGRAILAFSHFVFAEKASANAATAFITAIVEGAGLTARDPILYARNRLMAERGRLRPNEKAELIFRAWNAHRRRETPKTMPILGGALPTVER